jgi:hypothetical protein
MSDSIVVNAPFSTISQLATGFVERVSSDSLVLPSASPITPGQWTKFSILLSDGTVAFSGIGLSTRTADRGAQAPARARYDVLLESLRFDEASMRIFESLVAASLAVSQSPSRHRGVAPGPEWTTADVSDDEVEQIASDSMPAVARDQTRTAGSAQEKSKPMEKNPYAGSVLQRPVTVTTWQPPANTEAHPGPVTGGLFQYRDGVIPRPARAPRPELAPGFRVAPAPKPIAPRSIEPAVTARPKEGVPPVQPKPVDVITYRPEAPPVEAAPKPVEIPKDAPVPQIEPSAPPPVEETASAPPSDVPPSGSDAPFPPERDTAKIEGDKLKDLLASERSTKGRRRRSSKNHKR